MLDMQFVNLAREKKNAKNRLAEYKGQIQGDLDLERHEIDPYNSQYLKINYR